MKKVILAFLLIAFSATLSYADPIQMAAGTYTTPEGYRTIAQLDNIHISHNRYYTWGLEDLKGRTTTDMASMDIVFHNIYDNSSGPNWLNVYLFNEPSDLGYDQPGRDESDPNLPNWAAVYAATKIGTWSYDHNQYDWRARDTFDVVFTVTDPELLTYLLDGETFGIGFDPDCSFNAEKVSVLVPVPEPTSMILLGISLIGLAGISRRKFRG